MIGILQITAYFISVLSAVAAVVTGCLVYFGTYARRKDRRAFFLLAAVLAWWILFTVFTFSSQNTCCVVLAARIMHSTSLLLGPALYYFVATLVSDEDTSHTTSRRTVLFAFVLSLCLMGVLFMYPEILYEVGADGSLTYTPIVYGYLLYIFLWTVAALILLYRHTKKSAGIFKYRSRELLYHAAFASVVMVVADLLLPALYGIDDLYWAGPFTVAVAFFVAGRSMNRKERWRSSVFVVNFSLILLAIMLLMQFFFITAPMGMVTNIVTLIAVLICGYFLQASVKNHSYLDERTVRTLMKLKRAHARLESLDKEKTYFITVASHRLRDPLTAIKGFTAMLLEGSYGKNIDAPIMEAIRKMHEASQRLVAIVNDFMTVSNIESEDIVYQYSDFDVVRVGCEVVDDYHVSMPVNKEVTITCKPYPHPLIVHADQGKVRQVLSNLVDNAYKYTPKGEVTVRFAKDKKKGVARVSVIDTGVGIDKDTLKNLFKKFSRAKGASKINTSGSGLGLYVAKELMEHMGGRVYATSLGPGKGSTFVMEVPLSNQKGGASAHN